MKTVIRRLALVLCLALLLLTGQAAAAGAGRSLTVNGKTLDLSDLPRQVWEEDGCVMIPLRRTAEALGCTVSWLPEERCARVEDSIQSVAVRAGSAEAGWVGKLTVINLTRTETMDAKAVILEGTTYVPAKLFEGFFDQVTVGEACVSVMPGICTPDGR